MNIVEQTKQLVQGLLKQLSFEGFVEVTEEQSQYRIAITVESDQSLLIGQAGAHLAALQHIVRLLLRKLLQDEGLAREIYLDVNGYWKEKEQKLADEARARAATVLATGEEQTLPFMESHDRKIVHAALVSMEGVQTESSGVGRERRMRIFATNQGESQENV